MTNIDEQLPGDRLARRREHLMSETAEHRTGSARLSRRSKLIIGAFLSAALAGGGGLAAAGGPAVLRQSNGVIMIDGAQLVPLYYGQRLSLKQVQDLNKDHKAMFSVNNIEVGCHGVSLYFDTDAEADAYGEDYVTRAKALQAKRARERTSEHTPADPCADWKAPLPTFSHPAG